MPPTTFITYDSKKRPFIVTYKGLLDGTYYAQRFAKYKYLEMFCVGLAQRHIDYNITIV